tara:strand:+ start:35 stop:205 length:171 start_codon:yes stop_codon:yes gene_type:complete
MSYEKLQTFYQTCYYLVKHAKLSKSDVDNMIPWEKEIYMAMFLKELKERNEQNKHG